MFEISVYKIQDDKYSIPLAADKKPKPELKEQKTDRNRRLKNQTKSEKTEETRKKPEDRSNFH